MKVFFKLERLYYEAKGNKWFRYFAVFCRIVLALGFIPSGIVKVMGDRFTGLPANHPLGHYFDALYQTGYYYTFIGIAQLTTALLLLIPKTALIGAVCYFPIILNICILAYATRFEGTRITTLMLLANIYLLCWDYHLLQHILPFNRAKALIDPPGTILNDKFPVAFFLGVFATAFSVILINHFLYEIRPGNSAIECSNGCLGSKYPNACKGFCNCIYEKGQPLQECLEKYKQAKEREKNSGVKTNPQ